MPNPARVPIAALRTSHDRLAGLADRFGDDGATRGSYCDDWTVAQVYSHLGSGAEINLRWLAAARAHTEPIGQDEMKEIWAVWDARGPQEQVTEAVRADARLVEAYEAMSDEELAAAHIALFGGAVEVDGSGLALFRLPELSMHTWDVAVVLDPSATVDREAVDLLVDDLPNRLGWQAKPTGAQWSVTVVTTDPDRAFRLTAAPDSVTLRPVDAGTAGDEVVRMPAEALLRMAFGRLDEANAHGVDLSGTRHTLGELTAVFPGF